MTYFLKSIPDLHCYREYPDPPPIVPGRPDRAWMDATTERFAYRCTPLPIANSSGWELTLPMSFIATWNGGRGLTDIQIKSLDGDARLPSVVGSVFGQGVLTFHPGYHFRTSPGWALWVRGAPNTLKDGIVALEGVVETDWLPFTFTMNWRFTRPTTVRFDKGEAFCFLVMTPHGMLDEVQPVVCDIGDDPAIKAGYDAWRQSRSDFQARVARGDRAAIEQGWQRNYVRGHDPSGQSEPIFHLSKRRLKAVRPAKGSNGK
jgi:hypothetical protein